MTAHHPAPPTADASRHPAGGDAPRRWGELLQRHTRAAGVVTASAMLVAGVVAPAAAAPPNPGYPVQHIAGPWALTGWRSMTAGEADQGVATVSRPGGSRQVLRGGADVSARLRAAGWWHIGDPGSANGFLLDAYQAQPAKHAKLYGVTTPDGHRTWWVHRLVAGEKSNNSFAAVAPSGRWFVSGEWGKMRRLLVFPMPGRNRLARHGHDLPLVATIRLARPVSGRPQTGRPTELGPVPQLTGCGPAETEGIDVHNGRLLLAAHEPASCGGRVDIFTYRLKASIQPISSDL